MNIFNELIHGKGYKICKIQDINKYDHLIGTFVKKFGSKNKKYSDLTSIRKDLANFTKAEINNYMIALLSFDQLSTILIESCKDIVEELCGRKLFIQRRAHTIINIPGNGHSKQWPHYEIMSGISPFTFILWAPLHNIDDESGAYFVEHNKSLEILRYEYSKGHVNSPLMFELVDGVRPLKLRYGQVILFNPFVIHGNNYFNSSLARIAFNVRFQSSDKPVLQKNSDYFKYYEMK